MSTQPRIAVFYEHPEWFKPLFATLERRGISYVPLRLDEHFFDLNDRTPPAPVIFSRVAMSSFPRQDEHGIFYAQSLLRASRATRSFAE